MGNGLLLPFPIFIDIEREVLGMNRIELDKYFSRGKDELIETVLTHAPITLAANGSSEISIPVPSSYDFVISGISGHSTSTYSAKLSSVGDTFPFSNNSLHSSAFIGTGNIPYEFPYPFMVKKRGGLRVEVADLSGAGNTIQIQIHGYAIYKESLSRKFEERHIGYSPFFYTTDSTFSVATTDTDQTISIVKDFDFLCTKWSYFDSNSSTNLKMKMQHSSGNQMQNSEYIKVSAIMGGAQYPKILKEPTLFAAGSVVSITAQDTVADTFYIVLGGIVKRIEGKAKA